MAAVFIKACEALDDLQSAGLDGTSWSSAQWKFSLTPDKLVEPYSVTKRNAGSQLSLKYKKLCFPKVSINCRNGGRKQATVLKSSSFLKSLLSEIRK